MPFELEELLSYELGFKSTLPDGDVRFNATAFYYDYENYQALTFAGLSQFIDITNSEVSHESAYTVFNARIGFDISENLAVSVFVKNPTD
ncbi:TonB-dependent receptor [Candidatus Colwellia aromaticivorans]|uniref:TonB-dependent receptor n=1 Tax=Candidatus Colwellia aromaticivorans TaxID=2267621 RepID=UPI000DF39FDE